MEYKTVKYVKQNIYPQGYRKHTSLVTKKKTKSTRELIDDWIHDIKTVQRPCVPVIKEMVTAA